MIDTPIEIESHGAVAFGDRVLEYQLQRANCSRMSITVHPEGTISVRAPKSAADEEVQQRVLRRSRWIIKQLKELDALRPLQPNWEFVSGETHRYLGRQYRLKVRQGEPRPTKLIGPFFEIFVRDRKDKESIKASLNTWYRSRAKSTIDRVVDEVMRRPPLADIPVPVIQLREMQCRWGSCTTARNVLFNPLLIRTPRSCVRYVVAHELCHLVSLRHDAKFFRTLDQVEPRWRELRVLLNATDL
jgi:predicted metal-dependent hydrolase